MLRGIATKSLYVLLVIFVLVAATPSATQINLETQVKGILAVINGGTGLSAPGTNGNVLTSNGTIWTSSAPTSATLQLPSFTACATPTIAGPTGLIIQGAGGLIFDATCYAGATVDVKVNSCITAAKAVNGTCDARGLGGNQTIAAQIDVGDGTNAVTLLLPDQGSWNSTISDSVSCPIKQFGKTSIISINPGGASQFLITNTGSTTPLSLYCTDTGGQYRKLEGVKFRNSGHIVASGSVFNWQASFDNSSIRDVTVLTTIGDTYGAEITTSCCSMRVEGLTVDGTNTAGVTPLHILGGASGLDQGIQFYSPSIDHPGATLPNIKIDGVPRTTIDFYGIYEEGNNTDTTTTWNQIDGAGAVRVFGHTLNARVASTTAAAWSVTNTYNTLLIIDGLSQVFQFTLPGTAVSNSNTTSCLAASPPCLIPTDAQGNLSSYSTGTVYSTKANASQFFAGADNSTAGSLQISNGSASAHTIFTSGATTTNTIAGFATVPTTGHIVTCTTSGTTCTLTDGGSPAGAGFAWGGDGSDSALNFDGTNTFSGIATTTGAAPNLVYTLVRDVFATTLTVAASKTLRTAQYRVFATVSVTVNGTLRNNGVSAVGVTSLGQFSGETGNAGTLPKQGSGTTLAGSGGGAGSTGNGNQGALGTAGVAAANAVSTTQYSPASWSSGKGGNSGGNTGGAARANNTSGALTTTIYQPRVPPAAITGTDSLGNTYQVNNSTGGAGGGGGGAGDGTNPGSAGGIGGGQGGHGGEMIVSSPTITVGAAGIISADGGTGGGGTNGAATGGSGNRGGGGGGSGGAGGNGGVIWLVYHALANSGAIHASAGSGGTHGTGAAPTGTALAGDDGQDGPTGATGFVIQIAI